MPLMYPTRSEAIACNNVVGFIIDATDVVLVFVVLEEL